MLIKEYLGKDEEGKNLFVVAIPIEESNLSPALQEVQVVHDYVKFKGKDFIDQNYSKGKYPFGHSQFVGIPVSVTFHIKDMIEIVLPYLNQHEFLQKDHIKDEKYSEDDQYYTNYGLDKPRWKKGELYPSYASIPSLIKIKDKVFCRRSGEKNYSTLTIQVYEYLKNKLKLFLNQWDLYNER